MAVWQAAREGLENFSVLVAHVLVPPAIEAILSSPNCRVQAFLAAGHVCTVMGYDEYEPHRASATACRSWSPASSRSTCWRASAWRWRNWRAGAPRWRTSTAARCAREGNRPAQQRVAEVFEVSDRAVARHRRDPAERLAAARAVPPLRRRGAIRPAGAARARGVRGVHQRPGAAGAEEAARMPGLRHALHARAAARRADGLVARAPAPPTTGIGRHQAMQEIRTLTCPRSPASPSDRIAAGARRRRQADEPAHRAGVPAGVLATRRSTRGTTAPCCRVGGARLAFTTDSYVVRPLFFPGGDIGDLAVYGTVNDLAMCGARPLYLSAGFILEEGLPDGDAAHGGRLDAARRRTRPALRSSPATPRWSTRARATACSSTRRGSAWSSTASRSARSAVQPGDAVIVSGDLGAHGIAIMSVREGLEFEAPIESDSAPLWAPVEALLAAGIEVHCLRDLTRGGLASALNEIASARERRHAHSRRPRSRWRRWSAAPARFWGSTRSTWPTRAGSWPSCRRRRRRGWWKFFRRSRLAGRRRLPAR